MSEHTTSTVPGTAKEALELWDKGEAISAFEVESQINSQDKIYAVAFEMMRAGRMVNGKPEFNRATLDARGLTKREADVAHSIAYVALLKGWAAMVAQHSDIKAITVKKS